MCSFVHWFISSLVHGLSQPNNHPLLTMVHGPSTMDYVSHTNLSGVTGKSLTLLPVALNTALVTAAAMPISDISPMPFAPIGLIFTSGLFTNMASICGISALTGTW